MGKQSDEIIRQQESDDLRPRVSLFEKELNTTLVDERHLNNVPWYRKFLYKLLPIEVSQIIEALIMQRDFDVVISYYERVGLPLAYAQKMLRLKTPHVLITTWMSAPRKVWFLKRIHEHIAKIITWSSKQRQFAIEEIGILPSKITLIKAGTDQKFWRPMASKTDMICAAGMEMRDYPTLIKALLPLDIPCHIAVSSSARGQIYDTVKKLYEIDDWGAHITAGFKKYADLRELYARSRFVVIPLLQTDTDNGLTVMLEAMAMGKPVICSRVEGQVDIMKEGVTGIFVPQGDPDALREAIVELWNDPKRAEEMGKAARKYIEEERTLEQFVGQVKTEVEKVVHCQSPKRQRSKSFGLGVTI